MTNSDSQRSRRARPSSRLKAEPGGPPPRTKRRRPQVERKHEAEQRLLAAALKLVSRRGTMNVSLADVGKAAGFSRGLPAHHFGNKEGLLRALGQFIQQSFDDELKATSRGRPGLDELTATILVYFGRTERQRETTRALFVMMTESLVGSDELRKDMATYVRRGIDDIEQRIRNGIQSGQFRGDVDPRSTAVLFIGAMRGAMLQHMIDKDVDLPAVRDQLLAFVHRLNK